MPQLNVNDTLTILRKMSLRRIWNIAKVWSSFYISKWSKKPIQWGLPVSVAIEPTTSCNLRCPECPSGLRSFTRPTGMLQEDFFRTTVDQLSKDIFYMIFYFQGEPYLNPAFLQMVRYAADKNLYTATSTNGHYLTEANARQTVESGLDRLIISIDGTTQDVYQQYRVGGQLEKVIEGAKRIVKWKKELKSNTPFIIFQFLVVKPNEHQIEDVKRLGVEVGVDQVRFKTAQVYDYETDPNNLIPNNKKYSRYKIGKDGKMIVKSNLENQCWRLWHAPVITWDGLVVPCCFDKDADHKMGDLKKQSFKELWQQKEYKEFRNNVLHGRKNIDICANCSEGTKVWEDA
ncbi:MAG: SPASM domain-containing protein [Chitinophagaceae bacterium]|uniref:radical SAM/SPASM domain-containing protein n=2 Tax=unclassified Paraflavitalea TaxID=2798305 RepID=UPI003D33B097|nr:SPASM domain-containing protein [Chitinophagaceae bacterium]